MDRVPINDGYMCGECGKFIPMNAFDGINQNNRAICYGCRGQKIGARHAMNHLKRVAESMGVTIASVYGQDHRMIFDAANIAKSKSPAASEAGRPTEKAGQ